MSGPVYEVRVTLKGRPALVPMQALHLLGDNWAVGYIMPSGHRKKFNCKGNVRTWPREDMAADVLQQLAAERRWKRWPEDRPQKCIFLDGDE